ncbi:MAG: DUF1259 domain-containing protein, partial [Limisphaerales bacterium]
AFEAVKKVRNANAAPAETFSVQKIPAKNSIAAAPLEKILGVKGESKDGMFKAVIGRKVTMPCGCQVGKEMGVNTWAAFGGSDDNAVVAGDCVVLADELQPVLKSLRSSGVNIVAIHHHMTHEEPRMFFLHYWGRDKAANLATAVKRALAHTAEDR